MRIRLVLWWISKLIGVLGCLEVLRWLLVVSFVLSVTLILSPIPMFDTTSSGIESSSLFSPITLSHRLSLKGTLVISHLIRHRLVVLVVLRLLLIVMIVWLPIKLVLMIEASS